MRAQQDPNALEGWTKCCARQDRASHKPARIPAFRATRGRSNQTLAKVLVFSALRATSVRVRRYLPSLTEAYHSFALANLQSSKQLPPATIPLQTPTKQPQLANLNSRARSAMVVWEVSKRVAWPDRHFRLYRAKPHVKVAPCALLAGSLSRTVQR